MWEFLRSRVHACSRQNHWLVFLCVECRAVPSESRASLSRGVSQFRVYKYKVCGDPPPFIFLPFYFAAIDRFSTMAQEAVGSGESSSDADAAAPKRAEDYIQTASQCYGTSML